MAQEIKHHHLWAQYSEKIFITTDSGATHHRVTMKIENIVRYFDQFDIATIVETLADGLTKKEKLHLFKHLCERKR